MGLAQVAYLVGYDSYGNAAAVAQDFHVAPFGRAPGCFVKYYNELGDLLAPELGSIVPPAKADFATREDNTTIEGPPYLYRGKDGVHVVQIKFIVTHAGSGNAILAIGGADRLILVDRRPYLAGSPVAAG